MHYQRMGWKKLPPNTLVSGLENNWKELNSIICNVEHNQAKYDAEEEESEWEERHDSDEDESFRVDMASDEGYKY